MTRPLKGSKLYIAGGPGGNSIGPAIHDHIAKSLSLSWTCEFLRLSDVQDVLELFHRDDFAGGIVTMPHKRTIIPLLDSVDTYVREIGACNFVVRQSDGKLHGTNTDWSGIKNAIVAESTQGPPDDFTAMIYGAGGASRGALYALTRGLGCRTVYIVNRDDGEVEELLADVETLYGSASQKPQIVYLKSVEAAEDLRCPTYIISTVPDFAEKTPEELVCRQILQCFLDRGRGQGGVLLEMCYHPPVTRNLSAALAAFWKVIPGFLVVCHQFSEQWDLWTGRAIDDTSVFNLCHRLVKERDASKLVAAV